jgi:DMSO reductase anchor subunit
MSAHARHWPLVVFTSFAIAGAGLVAASACAELVYGLPDASALAAGTVLLAAGLAVSLGHLGQKARAGLALRGAWRSALSNEVLFAGLALAAAALAAGLDLAGTHTQAATALAGALSAAFLVTVGLVYRIRGQRTWTGCSAVTPLSAGLAFGAIAVRSGAGGGALLGTLLLIGADALCFAGRWRDVAGIALTDAARANPWMMRRRPLLAARVALLDVAPALLLLVSPASLAVLAAAAGLVVDRFGFYALALQHTTEHEVAGVEARIDALGRAARD